MLLSRSAVGYKSGRERKSFRQRVSPTRNPTCADHCRDDGGRGDWNCLASLARPRGRGWSRIAVAIAQCLPERNDHRLLVVGLAGHPPATSSAASGLDAHGSAFVGGISLLLRGASLSSGVGPLRRAGLATNGVLSSSRSPHRAFCGDGPLRSAHPVAGAARELFAAPPTGAKNVAHMAGGIDYRCSGLLATLSRKPGVELRDAQSRFVERLGRSPFWASWAVARASVAISGNTRSLLEARARSARGSPGSTGLTSAAARS